MAKYLVFIPAKKKENYFGDVMNTFLLQSATYLAAFFRTGYHTDQSVGLLGEVSYFIC